MQYYLLFSRCKFISNEDLANIFATHVLKVPIVWRVIFYRRKYTLFAQKMIVLENKVVYYKIISSIYQKIKFVTIN